MPIVPIYSMGSVGLVKDMDPSVLPFPAWDVAENVRFEDGAVRSRSGDELLVATPSFEPKALFFTASSIERFVAIAGDAKVFVLSGGGTLTDKTNVGGDYTATGLRWTGGNFNGVLVINNSGSVPQYWLAGSADELQNMPNWNAAWRCGVLRLFRNFLVAFDITKSGQRDPHLVKWSHPADPGDLPTSWDETDPLFDAGEFPLSDTPGYIIDALAMQDSFIIYKEDSVWSMQYTGGIGIFSFRKLFDDIGMMAAKCAVQLPNGQHAVLAIDDIYTHNGQQWESIVDGRLKRFIFGSLNENASAVSYVVLNLPRAEVMFCVPWGASDYPNMAFCWKYTENTWSMRDLHNTADISVGNIPNLDAGEEWYDEDESLTWEMADDVWDERASQHSAAQLYGAYPALGEVRVLRTGLSFPDGPIVARAERKGLGVPFRATQPPDMHSMKFFRGVRPLLSGPAGEVVQISMGVQQHTTDVPEWYGPYDFTIGSSEFVDVRGTGRLFAFRIESSGASWELHGYELDVERAGRF